MASRTHELSPDVGKVVQFLQLLITAKKLGIREVERRTEMSYGTLARLFSGKITLKFQTILDLLEVLEVSPNAFFSAVFSDALSPDGVKDLMRVQTLALLNPHPPVGFTRDEIKQMIQEALATQQGTEPT
jgi:transcriptional regulator with XRE-family HTH domain